MLKRFAIVFLILTIFYMGVGSSSAYALTLPDFPSCVSPQGTLRVTYSQGNHGIVGRATEYRGSDSVYTLTNDTLMQCFCPDSGQDGIQTNWWKFSSLTFEELKTREADGWILVPNGALWGLESVPYLAKNSNYSCRGGIGGPGGEINRLVSTAEASSLAGTGGSAQIFALTVTGFLSLFTGLRLRRKKIHRRHRRA